MKGEHDGIMEAAESSTVPGVGYRGHPLVRGVNRAETEISRDYLVADASAM